MTPFSAQYREALLAATVIARLHDAINKPQVEDTMTSTAMTSPAEVGDIVLYTLSERDAASINKRRADAERHRTEHQDRADGSQIHVGRTVEPGERYPMIIVRVVGVAVDGQVILTGNDTYWAAAIPGEEHGHYQLRERDKPTVNSNQEGDKVGMDIGGAVAALRAGHHVACASWEPGRYLRYVPGNKETSLLPRIEKVYANGEVMAWAASHPAILAQNWRVVNS